MNELHILMHPPMLLVLHIKSIIVLLSMKSIMVLLSMQFIAIQSMINKCAYS